MISVDQALKALFALVEPLSSEAVDLRRAAGRVLRAPAIAARTQPPFDASAMDGYALRGADAVGGATLTVIGEAAAGHAFEGSVGRGQAVRIFTGAPLPDGADHVEIQENVERDGDHITLTDPDAPGSHIRKKGQDFEAGFTIDAPRRLGPSDIALLAAMNVPSVQVTRRPEIALITTGDELVMPGEAPRDDQIIASNALGLAAMIEAAGGIPRLLPIAKDNADSLSSALRFARGADLIVTIGGASVGDHDIVRDVVGKAGLEQSFYKLAMRPGKPLMAGKIGGVPLIGLPGNPVSAMVCGEVFLRPMIDAMLGFSEGWRPRTRGILEQELPPNGPREHYMRGYSMGGLVWAHENQDSARLRLLAESDILIIRPPHAEAAKPGDAVPIIRLTQS